MKIRMEKGTDNAFALIMLKSSMEIWFFKYAIVVYYKDKYYNEIFGGIVDKKDAKKFFYYDKE